MEIDAKKLEEYYGTPTGPKYVNLLDALDDNSFLDYTFKDKQFVLIKKSKFMAVTDFIYNMCVLGGIIALIIILL